MSREEIIGGEYSVTINDNLTKEDCNCRSHYYASGRTALSVIVDSIRISLGIDNPVVYVPDYICKSVVDALVEARAGLKFYKVDATLLPTDHILEALDDINAFLVVNYFGLLDLNPLIARIKKINNSVKIIVDDVMNYYGFGNYDEYDYSYTSFRKWFPVPDGAEIKCFQEKIKIFENENSFYQYKLAGNILKNYRDIVGDDICLELLTKGEALLDRDYMASSSHFTDVYMNQFDKKDFANKRIYNAKVLHEGLVKMGVTHLYKPDVVPLFIPIFLKKNRDNIRKKLFMNNIFCPIHWPADWQRDYSEVSINNLYNEELSLICDHRYGEEEMFAQLEILKNEIQNS